MIKKHISTIGAAMTLLSLSTVPASAATFFDTFSEGLDPEWWTVLQSTENLYTVDASHGDVRLAKSPATTPGGVQNVMVRLNLQVMGGPVVGDFSAQVDFSNAVVPGPGLDQVELHTYYEDGSIYYAVYDRTSGYNTHVWDGSSVLGVIPNLSVDTGTFRISRAGNTVTAFFNETAMYSETRDARMTAVDFVLQNNAGSDDAISVTFDNFSLTAASVLPSLKIVPAGSSKVEVSWATNWTGCVLQQNTALDATPWTAVTNTPSVSGGRHVVTLETDGDARFFRLFMTE